MVYGPGHRAIIGHFRKNKYIFLKQQLTTIIRPRDGQPASLALTRAETWDMSARPASRGLSSAITLPISEGP